MVHKKRAINKKHISIGIISLVILFLTYVYAFLKPSNTRHWEVGFEVLPQIRVNEETVRITNLRDYRYAPGKFISTNYLNREVDVSQLERVWFIVEPFEGIPLINFGGIAHTYFVFDFQNEKPIVISVEARREKDEQFGLLKGMLNSFEIMYVWGTEEDLTQRRILIENNNVYMYPLTISPEQGQRLFLQLAKTSNRLESEPRFYNSLTSNCTNELAKNANMSKPGTIPPDLAWIFPGYSDEMLYKLGMIPNNEPLDKMRNKYYVSDLVKKHYNSPDFSKIMRQELLK